MATYEQKLNEFAQGKSLLRLARPVRDRADAFCDACGSTQPRTLYGLKDEASERYYFVGRTCLQELARRGAILRRFGKEATLEAYEAEMRRRAQGAKEERSPNGTDAPGGPANPAERKLAAGDSPSVPASSVSSLFPAILLIESPEHHQAFVSVLSTEGPMCSLGYAEESRYKDVWCTRWNGGMLLENVKRERPDALAVCLSRAWQEACSHLDPMKEVSPSPNGNDGSRWQRGFPRLLLNVLQPPHPAKNSDHSAADDSSGCAVQNPGSSSSHMRGNTLPGEVPF